MLQKVVGCFAVFILGSTFTLSAHADASPSVMALHEGWSVQSSCKLQAAGENISTTAYHPEGWYSTSVPATVLTVQVAAGTYKDPYFGTNLRDIPGTTYPMGNDFSRLPMPEDSPYRCGWWYRKQFAVPASEKGRTHWLRFGGINYRANIWVNGKRVADTSQVAGAYRTYELDVTDSVIPGKPNVVAVETLRPRKKTLALTG